MEKSLTMRSFANFMTRTVQDSETLSKALDELSTIIARPAFRTKIGSEFKYDQIQNAIQFKGNEGAKALLIPEDRACRAIKYVPSRFELETYGFGDRALSS